jgi:signal transduction histidine kinase
MHTGFVTKVRRERERRWLPLARHKLVVDAGLAVLLGTVGVVTVAWGSRESFYRSPGPVAVGLMIVAASSLWWWRSQPLVSLVVASGIVVVNAACGFTVGVVQYPVWIALFSVFARSTRRSRVIALGVVVAAVVGYLVLDRGPVDGDSTLGIAVTLSVAVLFGEMTRNRWALADSEREALLIRAREESAVMERTVLQERTRLARELHDALGHAVNVMVMQAGVGRVVFDEQPGFARKALENVETVGRDALRELDAVLRVLRPSDDEPREPMATSLSDLGVLCDRIRATGREVELSLDAVTLSASCERAAYRIVQEAITNAARHTVAGPISVSIRPVGHHAVVTVHNGGTGIKAPVAGRGLVNMRERARSEGGQFECGPVEDGFVVRATLPMLVGGTS